MAKKKNLSAEQILAALEAGGSTESVNPLRVLLALATNPERLAALRSSGREVVDQYSQFDPEFDYDPAANVNTTLVRYRMMPSEYQGLIKKFFDTAAATGGNKKLMAQARKQLLLDNSLVPDQSSRESLLNQMMDDVDNFVSDEASRQKKQYSAFMEFRKNKGFTSMNPEEATGQYLASRTGVTGLEGIATSIDELAKQKSNEFRKAMIARGKSEQRASELTDQFLKTFTAKAKEKKINPALVGITSVLKKNLLGG